MRRGLTLRLSETGQDRFRRARVQDLPGTNLKWGQGTFVTFVCLHFFIWSFLGGGGVFCCCYCILFCFFLSFFLSFSHQMYITLFLVKLVHVFPYLSLPLLSLYLYPPPFVLDNIFLIY